MHDHPPHDPVLRHDQPGWTLALRQRFLAHLTDTGDVRAAAACCGLSRQSAYKLRKRDAVFARDWAVAVRAAWAGRAEPLPAAGGWRTRLAQPGPAGDAARRFAEMLEKIGEGG